jgi:hypothetical protein
LDLIRRISELFFKQAEEAPRMVIITKNTSKNEIEKFEKEIEKKENEQESPDKLNIISKNPPNKT